MIDAKTKRLERVAFEKFGYESLRPGQQEAIQSVLAGRDTLAIMPTGAGKSAIYQIPAVMMPGPTVVISPLIALQKDQVETLREQDVGGAAVVNSAVGATEKNETLDDLEDGDLEFLFLTPEQLANAEMLERVKEAKPSLFVVDEAHCISEWGHDFRPDYLKLGAAIEALGHPIALALTATASPPVREEIVARLGMRDPKILVRGFDRPNIWLGVETYATEAAKLDALLDRIDHSEKPGIVYASSRRHAEQIAAAASDRGVNALYYHGGMTTKERHPIQDDFMADQADVIVATSAFGMGIDKPNVRFVYHFDIPHSIDAYYQEIGRAGRDGKDATAILFYRPEDLNIHKFFAGGGKLDAEKVERVAAAVAKEDGPVSIEDLRAATDLSEKKVARAIHRLEEVGAIETLPGGGVAIAEGAPDLKEAAQQAVGEQEKRHDAEMFRLERMRAYAETTDCRREYLIEYFGEEVQERCGACDNCQKPPEEKAAIQAAPAPAPAKKKKTPESKSNGVEPFPLRSRVVHKQWGKGLVERYDLDKIVVLFDDVGTKTLSVEAVISRALLEPM